MTSSAESNFKRDYQKQLQHLKLKGLQPKTIEAYPDFSNSAPKTM